MRKAIYDRKSVRTYKKKALTKNEKELIDGVLSEASLMKGPFGHQVKFFTDHQESNLDDEAKRIGTYGLMKNAPSFIGGTITNETTGIIDYGYIFESVILELTKHGFGTCWLGGTFNRGAFSEYVQANEIIPAITPVGHALSRLSLYDKTIRIDVKADHRKPFDQMFYLNDINHPLKESDHHYLSSALELVKLGPTSMNIQPWRVIIQGNQVHFYLERTPNFGTNLPMAIQLLDMGIALRHFELGLNELNISYQMKELEHPKPNKFEYILSFDLQS